MNRTLTGLVVLLWVVVPIGAADPNKSEGKTEDPAASKLLAEARAARANWVDFPGFSAELEVNFDGKVHRGSVEVSAAGKVEAKLDDPAAKAWATSELRSVVGHRLDNSADLNTPCAFLDDGDTHPLGRALRVLNDEFHSSYRVGDRQILVVNRQMSDARFTITVTENRLNEEKRFLPVSYVVSTWDLKTEALKGTNTFHHTWQRVGKFDLPDTVLLILATPGGDGKPGKLEARRLKLSNPKLAEAK